MSQIQRLKAADRRRKRRQPPPQATAVASPKMDVEGLLTETILTHAESLRGAAGDVVVRSAIRSVLRGSSPSGAEAQELADRLGRLMHQHEIPARDFRRSLERVLSTAETHSDPKRGDMFLSYLSVLAE